MVRGPDQVIPAPASVEPGGDPYAIGENTRIQVPPYSPPAQLVGVRLAELLRPPTGHPLPVTTRSGGEGRIQLTLGAPSGLGEEGYQLTISPESVVIQARTPAGLFYGTQTLRQLLPAGVEARGVRPGPWQVAGCTVIDRPRFEYRGAMLDVARHFFSVDQVKRYIDRLALYKINHLHLHLTDDQGWRIAIDSWPNLAKYGGSTQVGGGPGGYYTREDYREIVSYAALCHMTVVPEIDVPGHTNAALASYPELNQYGTPPPLYTGTKVGLSSLCVSLELTYAFLDDVVREVAALTPGPYLHIGGDEAHVTEHRDYVAFMTRAQDIVSEHGKTVIGWVGWHDLWEPRNGAVGQYWGIWGYTGLEEKITEVAGSGTRMILSPGNRAYLDMKYDAGTPLGTDWSHGIHVDVEQSYDWDPGRYLDGVPGEAVLGVEAPLWTATIENCDQIDYMAFPRLPGIAELGWSPAATRDWAAYRRRLGAHGPRWTALGINFYRSPQVDWDTG